MRETEIEPRAKALEQAIAAWRKATGRLDALLLDIEAARAEAVHRERDMLDTIKALIAEEVAQ